MGCLPTNHGALAPLVNKKTMRLLLPLPYLQCQFVCLRISFFAYFLLFLVSLIVNTSAISCLK